MPAIAAFLLLASGLTAILADRERWLPACAEGYWSDACLLVQNADYGVTPFPERPWHPTGSAAQLMGLSYALLALAVVLLTWIMLHGWWTVVAGLAFLASFGVLALATFASGVAGYPVAVPGTRAAAMVTLCWPVALFLAGGELLRLQRPAPWSALALGLLALASPPLCWVIAAPVVAVIAGGSLDHDTTPWTLATGGLLTMLAGVALLVGHVRNRTVRRTGPVATAA